MHVHAGTTVHGAGPVLDTGAGDDGKHTICGHGAACIVDAGGVHADSGT